MRSTCRRWGRAALALALVACLPSRAEAQRPGAKPVPKPPPEKPAPPETAAAESKAPDLLVTVAGGLTSEQAGSRASGTSFTVKAADENVTAAAGRTELNFANWFPRLGLTARYTRLSGFTPPSALGPFSVVVTPNPPGTQNPTPLIAAQGLSFPLVLDNYLLQATITIPISDYFLKISQGYTAATQQEEAAGHDASAARAKAYSDGKIAYFVWLRARGSVNVAEQSFAVAKAHVKDAEMLFNAGSAPRADVLRAQTSLASSELLLARAKNAAALAEQQLRVQMHAPATDTYQPGEALDVSVTEMPGNVRPFVSEALEKRPELKSLERNAAALKKLAAVARANRYPSVSGFGDVTYANPNPRRFPQTPEWFPTWALGAQVTWSPNDFVGGGGAAQDAEARASAATAQHSAARDGIELEVIAAHQAVQEADLAVVTTTRQLESANENYRVASELYKNGRMTATGLTDAETVLTQTKFEQLNARVEARIARVRFDHAVGRDLRAPGR